MAVEVVNVIGAGQLHIELELEKLGKDLNVHSAQYDPDRYPGIHIKISEQGPTITLYRNGKYHITGPDSVRQLQQVRDQFLSVLDNLEIQYSAEQDEFSVQNVVCVANHRSSFDLNNLAVELGLERVEYEPEQFPGLVYRMPNSSAVFLVFATGKIVITGVQTIENAQQAYEEFKEIIDSVFSEPD